jgi:hypothetical protein
MSKGKSKPGDVHRKKFAVAKKIYDDIGMRNDAIDKLTNNNGNVNKPKGRRSSIVVPAIKGKLGVIPDLVRTGIGKRFGRTKR